MKQLFYPMALSDKLYPMQLASGLAEIHARATPGRPRTILSDGFLWQASSYFIRRLFYPMACLGSPMKRFWPLSRRSGKISGWISSLIYGWISGQISGQMSSPIPSWRSGSVIGWTARYPAGYRAEDSGRIHGWISGWICNQISSQTSGQISHRTSCRVLLICRTTKNNAL